MAVKDTSVNIANTEILNFRVIESFSPRPPDGQTQYTLGQQVTAPLSRGVIDGTAIQLSNLNFSHVCDFRFNINLGLSALGLPDFSALIAQAIKNSKIRAAALIRSALQKAIDLLRKVLSALINGLGYDPTGQFALFASLGKDWIRKINNWAKKIAQFIEDALVIVEVFKQINDIINYIQSLPNRIKAMVKQCITNFLTSAKNLVNQVSKIPANVQAQVNTVINQVNLNADSALKQINNELKPQKTIQSATTAYIISANNTQTAYEQNLKSQIANSNNFVGLTSVFMNSISANTINEVVTYSSFDAKIVNEYITSTKEEANTHYSNTMTNMTIVGPAKYDNANTAKP